MKKLNFIFLSVLLLGVSITGNIALAEEDTIESSEVVVEKTVESSGNSSETVIETTESTTDVEEDTSSINPEKVVDVAAVEENIEKIIGEKKGADVPVESKPEVALIRESLLSGDYGITKEELDSYTDEQLEQTMTLFTRYNYDISGMDYGAYVRLLTTLFKDQTVNLNNALTQLAFDPAGFNSFSEMIPRVEELQVYLNTLYPTNSTFIPGIAMTNEQLITKLNHLQTMEDQLKAEGKNLPFGRIAGLIQEDSEEIIDSSTSESVIEETTESTKKEEVIGTSSDDKKDGFLPKTGETTQKLGLLGLGVLSVLGLGFIVKRRI